MKNEKDRPLSIADFNLAALLEDNREAFWNGCAYENACQTHKGSVQNVITKLIEFCRSQQASAHPWDIRQKFLEHRRINSRGKGYCRYMIILAEQVTRRYLVWLERHGHLPAGTARGAEHAHAGRRVDRGPEETYAFFAAKIDPALPDGLRGQALDYLANLVYDRQLVHRTISRIMKAVITLCRCLADEGIRSFEGLKVAHLDFVVSSLVSAGFHELLARRRQVQQLNSRLRCFVRYLRERGVVKKHLAAALRSPPCYRASAPPQILSEQQVGSLLDSVDRSSAKGRREYAILMLITTYGMRPVDVSRLKLDDIDWRNESICIVQSKTKRTLKLPLVAEVARAIYEYLRFDRDLQVTRRQVFLSLAWPHEQLRPVRVGKIVSQALERVGMKSLGARNLRASVVTHLLRQGQPLSTIQQVVGHGGKYAADTTQRYAAIDMQLLRRVLDEEER